MGHATSTQPTFRQAGDRLSNVSDSDTRRTPMYFANMYCYGMDHGEVGITGMLGCMGVVYKGAQALYAVHIPDHTQSKAAGAAAFAQFVGHFELITTRKSGDLFIFINGKNRPSAEEEARNLKSLLNA